jgi:4-diphosphocytidyl-2-C-methyl-D-erythritol kinase
LITFPNCKINLGLNVTGKRADGYHDVETVFYPLPLRDVLEIVHDQTYKVEKPEKKVGGAKFITTGLPINGNASKNLCVKAYQLLQQDFPALPAIEIYLHKVIPIGAGLGGGSADGTFTLSLLNDKFQLNLSTQQLLDYALYLGSDCPFFIVNRPCFGTGRGEFLQRVDLDLSMYSFTIVHPGIHVSTASAFEQLYPTSPAKSIAEIIKQPINTWKEELINDFEDTVLKQYAELSRIKPELYKAGAIYASMSGSGSCFYGIFPKNHFPALKLPDLFQVIHLSHSSTD